jgi:hypothetical protein
MELIDRYIYEVTRHLPAAQRSDIEKELRSLIDDMLNQQGGAAANAGAADAAAAFAAGSGAAAPSTAAVEAVLLELGDPRRLADNYRDKQRYVIGPLFYDTYWLVVRIVMIAVAFGLTLAMGIEFATAPVTGVWQAFGNWLNAVYSAILGAFAWVTLIFFLNERYNDQAQAGMARRAEQWHPRQLQPVPGKASLLKRSEPIAAIIFTVLFMIILNSNPDIIGIYFQEGGRMTAIPVLNPAVIRAYLPWINGLFGLSILMECIRLILGRWTIGLTIGYAASKVPPLVFSVWMLSDPALINPGFFSGINQYLTETPMPAGLPDQVIKVLIALTIFGFVVDMITLVVRAIRLAVQQRPVMLQ